MDNTSRRDLLKLAGLAALAARSQTSASVAGLKFDPKTTVRLGVIGTGGRGSSLVDNFAAVQGVQIAALCDLVEDKVKRVQAKLDRAGKATQPIALYHSDEHAFEK